jgi:D-xylose reductase
MLYSSNTQGALLIDIFRYARIPPQVLQIEHHPYLTQEPLIKLANTLGVAVTAYSSFGPQSFLELNMGQGVQSLLDGNDVIASIAKAHNKSKHTRNKAYLSNLIILSFLAPAQILLRWASQRGIAIIPKSNNQGRLEQNLASTDFNLTEDQIKAISALNQGIRVRV